MKPYNAIPEMLLKKAEAKILTLEETAVSYRLDVDLLNLKIQRLKKSRANLETQNKDLIRINNELTQELNDLKRERMSDAW